MGRLHLFELEDQSWFPNVLREGITDYLQFAANRIDLYRNVLPTIKKGLEVSKSNTIIDIGAGGGGGDEKILNHLQGEGKDVKIILTDKYPNLSTFKALSEKYPDNITYVNKSVDAMDVPSDLKGLRTLFVAFHHFKPSAAKKILEDAVNKRSAIGIFEATERSVINFIAMIFGPIAVMLAVPFIRPFKFSRLFFTYIIPLIPLAVMWDGMVSVLRTYSIKEMKQMTSEINAQDYEWEYGRIKTKKGPPVLYLLGYPRSA
jgi:hypothetical protein